VGVVALSFPLHPPGRPETSRLPELAAAGVPTVVVQGDRDPFGGPGDFPASPAYDLRAVPFADHSFRVPRSAPLTQAEAIGMVVGHVASWMRDLLT
jgi:predicted alpha/beta-hydrolase family hydrolase